MRTSCHRSLLAAAVAILVHAVPLATQPSSEAGFVVSKEGEWFVSSHASGPLSVGQVVHEGDSVWAGRGRGAGSFLSIALYSGRGHLELRCSRADTCDRRHGVPADAPGEGWVRRWLNAAREAMVVEARGYVPNITRNRPPPREAVLVRDSAGVDLAPVLSRISPGPLQLQAAALDSSAAPGEWRALRVDWNPGTPALVPAGSLPPGLYALRRAGQGDGWVLVVDASPEGADVAARFHELSMNLREWRGGAGHVDSRTVLRAVLHQLALEVPDPGAP